VAQRIEIVSVCDLDDEEVNAVATVAFRRGRPVTSSIAATRTFAPSMAPYGPTQLGLGLAALDGLSTPPSRSS
jgi:hypothetical protein